MYISLEKTLEQLAAQEPDAKDFLSRYNTMKARLKQDYYPWIQAAEPYLTDHGESHVQSVIRTASLLTEDRQDRLNTLEIFLLLSGIIWHDVGNILGRTAHAQKVTELIDPVKKLAFPEPEVNRLVTELVLAHEGRDGLRKAEVEFDYSTPNETYVIRPRRLAAILRFSDEVSENSTRVSREVMPRIPENNRIYWEFANCISATRPDPSRQRVVLTLSLDSDSVAKKFICPTEYAKRAVSDNSISLIQYVICRLEKMNNERAYCAQEFREIVNVEKIEARMKIIRGTQALEGHELTLTLGDGGLKDDSYPMIRIYDDFFEKHPEWSHNNLGKALSV